MIPEKLNELAVAAKNGDKAAMEELYRYFIPKINEIADEIWYMLKDESAFRYACYKQIEYAVGYYDPSKANFETVMMKTIYRTKYKYLNDEYRSDDRENVLMIESMTVNDKEGEPRPFEPPAEIAPGELLDVEKEVIKREEQEELIKKIASVGRGDEQKKRTVIKCWIEGLNDTETAEELGARFGGTFEANRKYIQRFKSRCRHALLA